jgi:hypothetical protein
VAFVVDDMSEAARLIDELTRAVEGDPWHGDAVTRILDGVPAEQARTRVGAAHTIWEIVRHLTAWAGEVRRRLDGHPAGEPQEGDWPAPSGNDDQAWRQDVAQLLAAHRRVLDALGSLSDASLLEPTTDPRDRETGAGVTRYVLLHGLSQHYAYHAGQIGLLKRLVQTARG